MKQKFLVFVVMLWSFLGFERVYGRARGGGVASRCRGKTICDFIVDGFEFAEIADGEVSCLYGITDIGHINTTKHCKTSCYKDRHYNCTCVPEDIAETALKIDGNKLTKYGHISLGVGIGFMALLAYFIWADIKKQMSERSEKENSSKVNLLAHQLDPQDESDAKTFSAYTTNDPYEGICLFVSVLLLTLGFSIYFYVTGASTRNSDFWRGC